MALENIGTTSSDVITPLFNLAWAIVWGKLFSQAWFYAFLAFLAILYFLALFGGRSKELQHAHYG